MVIKEVQEILEALEQTSDAQNAVRTLKGLLNLTCIYNYSGFIAEIKNMVNDYSVEHNLCPYCSSKLNEGLKFCTSCSKRV